MGASQPQTSPTQLSLADIATGVLADLAFMVSDDVPATPPAVAIWLRGKIAYRGPTEGTVCCWCTRGFAAQLAANLLGVEPDECASRTEAEDALREFMNVLCGQLVVAWYGKTDVFPLSIPTACETIQLPTDTDAADYCQIYVSGTVLHLTHRRHAAP